MADKPVSKIRKLRKTETVRERSTKPAKPAKTRKLKDASKHISKPLKLAAKIGKKEYYLPMPNNKVGKFLNKKRKLIPSYFVKSFNELKQVEWPNRKATINLTTAVVVFAVFFSLIVALTDYGLDKLFEKLIIK